MTADHTGAAGLSLAVEGLDQVVVLGEQLGLCDELDQAREVLAQVSQRRRLAPETTVVALLGATGSGKSSLTNALTGTEVSRTARTRPTTTQPLAVVPDTAAEATALLDWLMIGQRVSVGGNWPLGEATVLVDLPDIDSDELRHRDIAERMAGKVDVLVWVLDPEKYADGVVHHDFLIPMAAHADVMVVALNQVDRLDVEGREAVVSDLISILDREGLGSAKVVPVSARTGEGIETLARVVASVASDRMASVRSLAAHVRRAAKDLGGQTGLTAQVRRDDDEQRIESAQERQPLTAVRQAAASVAGIDVVMRAVERSDRHRAHIRIGWLWLRWIERLRRDPLRALHLGTGRPSSAEAGSSEHFGADLGRGVVDLSSLPHAEPAATGNLRSTAHVYALKACSGLPRGLAAQAVLRSDERAEHLVTPLDRAVAAVDYGASKSPAWWAVANMMQWVTALTALVGGLWLVMIHVLKEYLLLISIDVPRWGRVPWPTVLLLSGLLIGLVLAGLGSLLARFQARCHSRRVSVRLRRATDEVIDVEFIGPLKTETGRWAELARVLTRLAAHPGSVR